MRSADFSQAKAPGRVTVIGGHTCDNQGLAIVAAIPLYTQVRVEPAPGPCTTVCSEAFARPLTLCPGVSLERSWGRYVAGALRSALPCGQIGGRLVRICSDLPMREGLASSAALVTATLLAANPALRELPSERLLSLCRRVENRDAGVNCGILDFDAILHARPGRLLKIDCRDRRHEHLPWPDDLSLVVCASGAKRELARSCYNQRRRQCQALAAAVGAASLREVSAGRLAKLSRGMPIEARRARHVLAENRRVARFADALAGRDYRRLKRLMAEAHASARLNYQCSSPWQDLLVEAANAAAGCVGARLTGAGWGGATVNLVRREEADQFVDELAAAFRQVHPKQALQSFLFHAPAGGVLSEGGVTA